MALLGPQKGLILAPKGPFWAPWGPRRAWGARFGPNYRWLVQHNWSHGIDTLWPGIGPLLGPQGPQKGQIRVGNIFCRNIAMWGIKIVATKRPGHSTLRQHILNNQLEENRLNMQNGQNGQNSQNGKKQPFFNFCIFCFFPHLDDLISSDHSP